MYVRIAGSWFYLVDIVDGYSRYLVHWRLARTLHDWQVTSTVQEALDKHGLVGHGVKVVHDNGSQFVGAEWRNFIEGTGMVNIRTRVRHPESNGLLERAHRTHRGEGPFNVELDTLWEAESAMREYQEFYNDMRPHSALKYLCPHDYHFGDPERRLEEREQGMKLAEAARAEYWHRAGTSAEADAFGVYSSTSPPTAEVAVANVIEALTSP
jgi:transposase InsO family protein